MDTMTQQNAAMVEELAATAQSLSGHVRDVSNSMGLFWLKSGKLSVSQLDAVELRRLHKSDTNMSSIRPMRSLTTKLVAIEGGKRRSA
jgi:hypothetical protein